MGVLFFRDINILCKMQYYISGKLVDTIHNVIVNIGRVLFYVSEKIVHLLQNIILRFREIRIPSAKCNNTKCRPTTALRFLDIRALSAKCRPNTVLPFRKFGIFSTTFNMSMCCF
jgi:hypothetical protein